MKAKQSKANETLVNDFPIDDPIDNNNNNNNNYNNINKGFENNERAHVICTQTETMHKKQKQNTDPIFVKLWVVYILHKKLAW